MVEHARRDEVNAFFDANASFHEVFVIASGNQKLREMYRLLIDQIGRYLARSLALRGSLEKSIAEHAAILEAVEAGDVDVRCTCSPTTSRSRNGSRKRASTQWSLSRPERFLQPARRAENPGIATMRCDELDPDRQAAAAVHARD